MSQIKIDDKIFYVDEIYQEIYKENIEHSRGCSDRLYTILQAESGYNFNKIFEDDIVDCGSNFGYFVFSLAEKCKKRVVGIECSSKNIQVCNYLKDKYKINNAYFVLGKIPEDIPISKTYFLLSVLHHIQTESLIPESILNKIQNADTIYLELAHYLEWPEWARGLIPQEKTNPYLYWLKILKQQFPNFYVRLIGIHKTHIGSLRPMFLCKKKLNEKFFSSYLNEDGIIYERFRLPYIDFGDFLYKNNESLDENVRIKLNVNYVFANFNDKNFVIKFENNNPVRTTPFFDGLLLSDIIKFGLLPYYDRIFIKEQLSNFTTNNEIFMFHNDPHAWNFIVDENSNLYSIDVFGKSMLCDNCLENSIKLLMQEI